MRRTAVAVVVGLVLASCSGVSEEDHQKALADADQLREQVSGLESNVDALEGQLATSEGDLAASLAEVERLEESLAEAEDETSRAVARFGDLADLSEVPNTPAATLVFVLIRESVRCGVGGNHPGFSVVEPNGDATGFDADFCRAVAAAVLGDADAVEFVPLTAGERFEAVRFGGVDVLFRTTTRTLQRDAALGQQVDFGPPIFYDGLQLMGRSTRFESTSTGADIDGARVCVNPGAATASRVVEYAASYGNTVELVDSESSVSRLLDGTCDLITTDGAGLAMQRVRATDAGEVSGGDLVIFPTSPLTREPLAPAYIQGDTVWADIVDWVVHATIIAADEGITSTNIDSVEWSAEAARLFGQEADLAGMLGLNPDSFYQVIKQVGNYQEIFDRNLGPLGLIRDGTQNASYLDGGLIYAPPVR